MFDTLLARWSALCNSVMNASSSNSSSNSTDPKTFPMYHIDFQERPSTSNTSNTSNNSATNSSGWTVTTTGNNTNDDFARYIQNILNSTVTRPILSDLLYQPIVAAIVLASTFALWRKLRSPSGISALSWRDALGLALIGSCVAAKWMLEAVALTAAYVAWSSLADRQWNATSKLPDFDAFLASLPRPAASPTTTSEATVKTPPLDDGIAPAVTSDPTTADDSHSTTTSEATPNTSTSTPLPPPAAPNPESAILSQFEAQLGIPERKPEEECVICWTSDDTPLRLPCSHLVCEGCLARLRDANRYTCPYCSTTLFKPQKNKNKHLLYQLAVASSGAHLAVVVIEAALKMVHRRYTRAVVMLFFNLPSALFAVQSRSRMRLQGEEEYFAEMTEGSLGVQLGMSVYLAWSSYGRVPERDWAAFRDGEWKRFAYDDWGVMMFERVVGWVVGS